MIENYNYECCHLNYCMISSLPNVFVGILEVYIKNITSLIILNVAKSLKDEISDIDISVALPSINYCQIKSILKLSYDDNR